MQFQDFRFFIFCLALSLVGCAGKPAREEGNARLPIAQTERGVMIWLPEQVQFETGMSQFNQKLAQPHLDKLVRLLQENTDKAISIEGHADNVGTAEFNLLLSERRAETVQHALIQRGIAKARIKTAGFGRARPIAPNDTEIGRALNRRVELIVLNETVENFSRGEPANSFEAAFEKLREMFGQPIPSAP